MYDVFGECLVACVKRLDRDEMNSPEKMASYYKKLDVAMNTLKMFRFVKDVTLDSECNENGDHEIIITCEEDYYDNIEVNGESYFSEERPFLKLSAKYTLVGIDGIIFTTDDNHECATIHLARRSYLLKKLIDK